MLEIPSFFFLGKMNIVGFHRYWTGCLNLDRVLNTRLSSWKFHLSFSWGKMNSVGFHRYWTGCLNLDRV